MKVILNYCVVCVALFFGACSLSEEGIQDQSGTTLETDNVIMAKVAYHDGVPAGNASVELTEWIDNGIFIPDSITTIKTSSFSANSDGEFSLDSLEPGVEYFIELISDDDSRPEREWLQKISVDALKKRGVVQLKKERIMRFNLDKAGDDQAWFGIQGTSKFYPLGSGVTHVQAPSSDYSFVVVSNPTVLDGDTRYTITEDDNYTKVDEYHYESSSHSESSEEEWSSEESEEESSEGEELGTDSSSDTSEDVGGLYSDNEYEDSSSDNDQLMNDDVYVECVFGGSEYECSADVSPTKIECESLGDDFDCEKLFEDLSHYRDVWKKNTWENSSDFDGMVLCFTAGDPVACDTAAIDHVLCFDSESYYIECDNFEDESIVILLGIHQKY